MNLLVFSSGCVYWYMLEMLLIKEGVFLKWILEFGMIEVIIGCVKVGMGVVVMMKFIVFNYDYLLILILLL